MRIKMIKEFCFIFDYFKFCDSVTFENYEEGMKISSFTLDQTCLVEARVDRSVFSRYNPINAPITIDAEAFITLLAKSGISALDLNFKENFLNIEIEREDLVGNFKFPAIHDTFEPPELPAEENECIVKIQSEILQNAIKLIPMHTSVRVVSLAAIRKHFELRTLKEIYDCRIILREDSFHVRTENNPEVKLALASLKKLIPNRDELLTLKFSTDRPLKIEFMVNDVVKIQSMLAPVIDPV